MASEPGVKQHTMAHFDLLCFVFFCCSKNSERLPNLTTLLFRFIK